MLQLRLNKVSNTFENAMILMVILRLYLGLVAVLHFIPQLCQDSNPWAHFAITVMVRIA